jgi:hypothetical protein
VILKLLMPALDWTMPGGVIVGWHKAVGEWVNPGDDLFDILVEESRTVGVALRPSRVLSRARKGDQDEPIHGDRKGVAAIRVTATDMGYLRQVYPAEGAFLKEGNLVAALTTDPAEPLGNGGPAVDQAITFRVITNPLQYDEMKG